MTTVNIFYQGEGIREVECVEIDSENTFGALKALIVQKHGLTDEVLIFLEDADEPADEGIAVCRHSGHVGVKAHLHRCRSVEITVTFNGDKVHHPFGPGTTVARVKRWAAEHKFKMTEAEASEHVLQVSGTHDRPAPGTHIGSLVTGPKCRVAFDLVPDQRINGAYAGGIQ